MPQMKLTRSIGVLKNPNIIQNKKTAIIYTIAVFLIQDFNKVNY